jgi:mono/diheme cytochrome c family protein
MRMRIVGSTAAVLLGVSSAVVLGRAPAAAPAPADQQQSPVTFSKDVAPILYKNCVECHRPTMFAPMSLMTYEEARPWARSIKQRVVAREMPPWGADPAIGHFRNDPRLSQADIDTIAAWVDAGAPKGNDKDLPVRPMFVDGWTIGKPDAVFTMTEPFEIPATGTIKYQYIRIPTDFSEDKWLQAIEIKPGARAHVHHVIAYTQPAGTEMRSESPLGRTNIGGTTPNKPGVTFPDGVARLLRANSEIVLQVHYTTNGEAASDKTTVGMIFAKAPPKKIVRGGMALNPRFVIPAGAPNHEVVATGNINEDTLLTSMTPHMHTRGKDMTYIAIYPDGREETLLSVPKYDFEWQITYQLAEPKLLPKGSKLRVIAHFDNSTNNKFNPDPTKDVKWGDQTWEEMMIGFYGTIAELEPTTSRQQ